MIQTFRRAVAPTMAILAALSAFPASAGDGSLVAVVKPFYDRPGLEADASVRDLFVDPARKVFDSADRLRASGEGECLDPNMGLDNLTENAAALAATAKLAEAASGDEGRVVVIFTAPDGPHRLEWRLKRVDGAWKISDILSLTSDWALSQYNCE